MILFLSRVFFGLTILYRAARWSFFFFFLKGGEKCFTVFAFLEKQDRKPCFLNCGLLYRLLGHNQHTSWGEDFSHSEDPWSCRRGDTTFAWIRPRKQPQTCMCLYPPHQLQQRALSGRGERKGGTNDGRKRTHHSQSAQCCVCWTHTCQRKLALSRPKELLEIRSHRCLVGVFFFNPTEEIQGFSVLLWGFSPSLLQGNARGGNPASAPNI